MTDNKEASVGLPYGIIDPDYARVFTQARTVAWQYGYACVMHGSFTRDLDLLLVPWTDQAKGNFEQIIRLLPEACDDILRGPDGDHCDGSLKFTQKPHGRLSYSLHFKKFGDRRWVDISIMPTEPKQLELAELRTEFEKLAESWGLNIGRDVHHNEDYYLNSSTQHAWGWYQDRDKKEEA